MLLLVIACKHMDSFRVAFCSGLIYDLIRTEHACLHMEREMPSRDVDSTNKAVIVLTSHLGHQMDSAVHTKKFNVHSATAASHLYIHGFGPYYTIDAQEA